MADHARFDLFADFICRTFEGPVIYDVAGGMGKLNEALVKRQRRCITYDVRHKHLPVEFREKLLLPDEPCEADAIVGMHPDGATRVIIEYAARHQKPFAVVPCCSDNSMPYKPWLRFLGAHAEAHGFDIFECDLPMRGRNTVLYGKPRQSPALPHN